jgi:outer membrane protein assembly factor BamA
LTKASGSEHVALSIRIDLGSQYRLGNLQFRSIDPDVPLVFPAAKLREQVPMREGDIFDTTKLREGFAALKQIYSSAGWIDFTPTPNFDIDDAARRINLTLELDQQQQYRVGKVNFLGDNSIAEQIVTSKLKAGEPFRYELLQEFYAENKSILPGDASPDDVELKKNAKSGIVNLRFDFRTCPAIWE